MLKIEEHTLKRIKYRINYNKYDNVAKYRNNL